MIRAIFAVSTAAIVAVCAAAAWWMNSYCHTPVGRAAIKATSSIGCGEFWVNRYQTVASALIALAAAWLAAWLVHRQLWLMESDRILSLQEIARQRGKEASSLNKIAYAAGSMAKDFEAHARVIAECKTYSQIANLRASTEAMAVAMWALCVRAEEAYAGFEGGPKISKTLNAFASGIRRIAVLDGIVFGQQFLRLISLQPQDGESQLSEADRSHVHGLQEGFSEMAAWLSKGSDDLLSLIDRECDDLHARLVTLDGILQTAE